jgi:adenosylcobinamide-phosphate synthase
MTSESLTDSIVSPLFYWVIFGLPGAIAYRVINTFDAMIGYHGKYEYLGKPAAKADDVLNYIPARISGLLLVLASFITGADGRQAWFIMRRDHGRTESPNAGWTMAAAAGALGVELEKRGFYRLGNHDAKIAVSSIAVTSRLVTVASLFWFGLCAGISGACYAFNA